MIVEQEFFKRKFKKNKHYLLNFLSNFKGGRSCKMPSLLRITLILSESSLAAAVSPEALKIVK